MKKIAFIGAGSTVFARRLLVDILSYEELAGCSVYLFDIDPERLSTSEIVARQVAQALGAQAEIHATTQRRAALDGADYAISMFQVGGYRPATLVDFELPKKYGLRQTIADTLGIGGIMRGLRTVPVLLDICREMEEVCPDVLFLNHVNPMAINCWAISQASPIKMVGLCHSVQGTADQLAQVIGVPVEEIDFLCTGINHMAFYLRFERDGQDLYPLLRQAAAEGGVPENDLVRFEMLSRLGYFVTESSEHFSEYVPWFIKRDRPDLIERFNIPLDEYPRRCEDQISRWQALRADLEQGAQIPVKRSSEYTSLILHAIETGTAHQVNANVPNHGLISNLPEGCCVEVPCRVDALGIHPIPVGALPSHLAALIQTNVNVQALTVEAALTGKLESVYHAAMLDPHTAAELDLDQIWALVDELIEAHREWLPDFH
jgi:alpha-galactosidase